MENARRVLRIPEPTWERWQRWLSEDSFWPRNSVLVHGDLHPAHILIDEKYGVTGLLDWTDAHAGDAATDFTLMFATLGERALSRLLEEYRSAGGIVWPRMPEHVAEAWCAYPAAVAAFAGITGEKAHLDLAQALVDAAAGARSE
jgi:macrolide phosphotransferase